MFNTITSTYFCYNFHETNTLKCTNVESAVKLNAKKVDLLHEYTETFTPLVCSVIGDALLKAMAGIP